MDSRGGQREAVRLLHPLAATVLRRRGCRGGAGLAEEESPWPREAVEEEGPRWRELAMEEEHLAPGVLPPSPSTSLPGARGAAAGAPVIDPGRSVADLGGSGACRRHLRAATSPRPPLSGRAQAPDSRRAAGLSLPFLPPSPPLTRAPRISRLAGLILCRSPRLAPLQVAEDDLQPDLRNGDGGRGGGKGIPPGAIRRRTQQPPSSVQAPVPWRGTGCSVAQLAHGRAMAYSNNFLREAAGVRAPTTSLFQPSERII